MEKIILKIGDSVVLYNGTRGIISDINYGTYQIQISADHIMYSQLYHRLDIRYVNDVDCEKNNIEICLK